MKLSSSLKKKRLINWRWRFSEQHNPECSVSLYFDELMLNLYRHNLKDELLFKEKDPLIQEFIKGRAKMPIELPPVKDKWEESLNRVKEATK